MHFPILSHSRKISKAKPQLQALLLAGFAAVIAHTIEIYNFIDAFPHGTGSNSSISELASISNEENALP